MRVVADQVYKSSNNLNPNFTKEIFHSSPNVAHRKGNLYAHSRSTGKFGNKIIRSLEIHGWNSLLEGIN